MMPGEFPALLSNSEIRTELEAVTFWHAKESDRIHGRSGRSAACTHGVQGVGSSNLLARQINA